MKYLFIAVAAALVACSPKPKEESATLKEAREVHNRMMEVASSTRNLLEAEIARVQPKAQSYLDAGDTLMSQKMQFLAEKLAALRNQLQTWEQNVVAVPGEAGQAHDHAHESSGDHSHDHSHEANPAEGMSDEQMLEVQKSLEQEIQALSASLAEVQNEMANADTTQTQP